MDRRRLVLFGGGAALFLAPIVAFAYGSQGGTVTEAQDLEYRRKCEAILRRIQNLLYQARSISDGASPIGCA